MEAKRKFKLKRRYKTLMWLAYSTIVFFALFLITTIIIRNHSDADWTAPWIVISLMVGLLLPLFLGFILGMYAQFDRQQLQMYMKDIRIYRARKIATTVINYIQEDKIQEAVDLYIKMKYYPERILDDYLYGMLIARAQGSTIEKLQKVGQRKMNEVKEQFDPAKIKL
jgi:hypothetical protein